MVPVVVATCASHQNLMCHGTATAQVAVETSSNFDANHDQRNLCLDHVAGGGRTGAWSAGFGALDLNQWMMADFGESKLVTAVSTKGETK